MVKQILKKSSTGRKIIEELGTKRKRYYIQKYGIKELQIITAALQSKGICAFADFGTLLGIMREKGLLKHDADIDIGIIVNKPETIEMSDSVMQNFGYKLMREFTVSEGVAEQSYIKRHIKIDFQCYFPEQETALMYCYLFYNPGKDSKKQYWKSVIKKCPKVEGIKEISIEGRAISVPQNAEEILSYKYGENWRIPDKSWVYWEGPNTYPTNEMGFLKSIDNGGITK